MAKTNYSPTFPMFPGDAAAVTVSDTVNLSQPSIIFAGSGGTVKITTAQGTDVTFAGLQPGAIIPVQAIRVWSTGTSPTTNIVAIF